MTDLFELIVLSEALIIASVYEENRERLITYAKEIGLITPEDVKDMEYEKSGHQMTTQHLCDRCGVTVSPSDLRVLVVKNSFVDTYEFHLCAACGSDDLYEWMEER